VACATNLRPEGYGRQAAGMHTCPSVAPRNGAKEDALFLVLFLSLGQKKNIHPIDKKTVAGLFVCVFASSAINE